MELSIILPTYNNQQKLNRTLEKLEKSSDLIKDVVIVDDGSTIPVRVKSRKLNVKLIRQKNSGPAKARNVGVANSSGDLLMLIGDDILVSREVVKEHLAEQSKLPNLALTSPQKYLSRNMFTDFVVDRAKDEGYRGKKNIPAESFCSACVSIKRRFFRKFDESFGHACLEDTELAYRLKGVVFGFGKNYVYHDHVWNEEGFKKRQELFGYYYTRLWKAPRFLGAKSRLYKLVLPLVGILPFAERIYVSLLSVISFNEGIKGKTEELKHKI